MVTMKQREALSLNRKLDMRLGDTVDLGFSGCCTIVGHF
jgi:hypothetical protein